MIKTAVVPGIHPVDALPKRHRLETMGWLPTHKQMAELRKLVDPGKDAFAVKDLPDDVEKILKPDPPHRAKVEPPSWLDRFAPRVGWLSVGAILVLAWQVETKPKEVIAPVVHRELHVSEPKAISATETLRVITMPSDLDYFGTKCLLHTNTSSGVSALACGKEELVDDAGQH